MARAVSEKIAVWGSAPRAPIFGIGMFLFSGYQPVADGLLKTIMNRIRPTVQAPWRNTSTQEDGPFS
jgi:hypothetical protein